MMMEYLVLMVEMLMNQFSTDRNNTFCEWWVDPTLLVVDYPLLLLNYMEQVVLHMDDNPATYHIFVFGSYMDKYQDILNLGTKKT